MILVPGTCGGIAPCGGLIYADGAINCRTAPPFAQESAHRHYGEGLDGFAELS